MNNNLSMSNVHCWMNKGLSWWLGETAVCKEMLASSFRQVIESREIRFEIECKKIMEMINNVVNEPTLASNVVVKDGKVISNSKADGEVSKFKTNIYDNLEDGSYVCFFVSGMNQEFSFEEFHEIFHDKFDRMITYDDPNWKNSCLFLVRYL